MKKSMIASLIMMAGGVLASGVAGCSAETGAPGDKIGSASQAIVTSDIASEAAFTTARAYHASCVLSDGTEDYLLIAGGEINNTPTNTNTSYVYRPHNNTWSAGPTFNAVSHAAMLQQPGTPSVCVLFGGVDASGNAQGQLTKFTLTSTGGGAPTVTAANAGTFTARYDLSVAPCGSGAILAIGGFDGTSAVSTMEVWNGETGTTAIAALKNNNATPQAVTLNGARDKAAVAWSDGLHVVIAGGENGGSPRTTNKLEAIKLLTDGTKCKLDDTAASNPHPVAFNGTAFTARRSLQGFLVSSVSGVDTFKFVAGDVGGMSPASKQISDVVATWGTSYASTETNTIQTATTAPALAVVGNDHAFLFGGNVNNYQEDESGTWTSVSTYSDNVTSLPIRLGARAEFLSIANKVYVAGGINAGTYLSSLDQINP